MSSVDQITALQSILYCIHWCKSFKIHQEIPEIRWKIKWHVFVDHGVYRQASNHQILNHNYSGHEASSLISCPANTQVPLQLYKYNERSVRLRHAVRATLIVQTAQFSNVARMFCVGSAVTINRNRQRNLLLLASGDLRLRGNNVQW